MSHDPSNIERLRDAIDCLPVRTRVAMLEGIRANPIIVGAYVDGRGGVCPMLAAHRAGGRTDFIGFAKAWDRFTRAPGRARRATRRELTILAAHLEASLLAEEHVDLQAAIAEHRSLTRSPGVELGRAIAEHRRLLDRRAVREEHDPAGGQNLPRRRWRHPLRAPDDYAGALARLEAEHELLLAQQREPVGA
ncbi:MAG TPA: hypothetical protein VGN69_11040 [Solirubrobacteraceae bacterium]|jgi:hypothetical protein|nr:hypothetical protein [Solirubrobacteraceae bacterium]